MSENEKRVGRRVRKGESGDGEVSAKVSSMHFLPESEEADVLDWDCSNHFDGRPALRRQPYLLLDSYVFIISLVYPSRPGVSQLQLH